MRFTRISNFTWLKWSFLMWLSIGGILSAQTVSIIKPVPGAPLDDVQEVEISVTGGSATRVALLLNGKRVTLRRSPPFKFTIRWNTRVTNVLEAVAYFEGTGPVSAKRRFEGIRVDVVATVNAFQCFPFLEDGDGEVVPTIRVNGETVNPETWQRADKLKLHVVIALDVSGSMKFLLPDLEAPVLALLKQLWEMESELQFIAFDQTPVQIDANSLGGVRRLYDLYRGRPNSAVWDTVAAATTLFDRNARKFILLISDGADDGSRHSIKSAAEYLSKTETPLIWVNPTDISDKETQDLVLRSGGFTIFANQEKDWRELSERITNQRHLVIPRVGIAPKIKVNRGKIWYPHWNE